jgi:putative ABC transport system ATP-binding protein
VEHRTDALAASSQSPADAPWLLRDLTCALRPGEWVRLEGPSGSGKTLLLRALAGLDPLDEGRLLWSGAPLPDAEYPTHRARVMLVPQRPALIEGTVEQNLAVPYALRVHRGKSFDRGLALGWLERLGRDAHFLSQPIRNLSGGERQIVALLRALPLGPVLLLLDEPTAALDAETAAALRALLGEWWGAAPGRRSIVWVGHDAERVALLTTHTWRINAGRIEE